VASAKLLEALLGVSRLAGSKKRALACTIRDEDAVHVGQQPMQNTFPKMPRRWTRTRIAADAKDRSWASRSAWIRKTFVNTSRQMKTQLAPICQKLTLALLTWLSVALLAVSALPELAQGKGHGHSGGHGAHHRTHHGGSSGLWRQSPGSAAPGAGNTSAGHPSGVGQPAHPTSPAPTTVLRSPTAP